ncbi:TVP38/TMEM64 family protein [Clostridiaceae bacterium 35-E11]
MLLIYVVHKLNIFKGCKPEDIKTYLHSFGVWAPIIFIILFTFVPLTLFPDAILAVAGGMVFGLYEGFVYTMIGALCGATLSFYIARILGQNCVKRFIKHDITRFEDVLQKNGFFIVLLLRLIPLLPFDVISYSAGISKIKYKDFVLATILGTIPGILVYVNLGDKSTQIGTNSFYLSVALLILLFVGSMFLKQKVSLKRIQGDLDKAGI